MNDNQNFGFGKFVPGFDFLQNLAKGASQTLPQMPNLSNWIAPTLDPEELEKRIGELKAVHFWLDQNSKALGATIQALEVQKMTLATLKGMNFNMGEVAESMKLKATDMFSGLPKAKDQATSPAEQPSVAAPKPPAGAPAARKKGAKPAGQSASGVVDPLQWWGALTQQFQQIAATAMKDAAAHTAAETAGNRAKGDGSDKTATAVAKSAGGRMSGTGRKTSTRGAARKK